MPKSLSYCLRMGAVRGFRTLRRLLPYRRIALVGNGPVASAQAAEIDAHDLVIRFNACPNYGNSGRRTDVLVICNSGSPGRYLANTPNAIHPDALASAKQFWLTKTPETVFVDELFGGRDPGVCGDSADAFVAKHVGNRPWRRIDTSTYWSAKSAISAAGAEVTAQPSSGLLALLHVRETIRRPRPRVTLYGFTHSGWQGHAWEAERAYIDGQRWISRA